MTRLERRSRLAFEDKQRTLRRRAKNGLDTLLAAADVLLDADRAAPVSSLHEELSEPELRQAGADCRAFARLEERGLVDELTARGLLCNLFATIRNSNLRLRQLSLARKPVRFM